MSARQRPASKVQRPLSTVAEILFWFCLLALCHTYIIYPLLMAALAAGKRPNDLVFSEKNRAEWPAVSVLMSVFNEEKVIAQKLESLAALDYPPEKLHIFIGSDCSDDATDALCRSFTGKIPNLIFHRFDQRRGKPSVINDLAEMAFGKTPPSPRHIFLLTDASVMLAPDVVFQLAKHFKNEKIGAVDAQMRATGIRSEGISRSENRYLTAETSLKTWESRAWGLMIGPFGGCYALRSDLFEAVPTNHLVDDFYLVFRALERGFLAVNELEAVCHEGATHRTADEYRRKKRIAAGSFQNLSAFRRWVLPPASRLGFAFFSHKVLRWFGGFLLGGAWLAAACLAFENQFYRWAFWGLTLLLAGVPLADWLCQKLKINVPPLKNLAYFVAMNLALTEGFFKFWKGIREGTWQRTARE